MADQSHTGFPRSSARMPYFAPALGAMPLPGAGAVAEARAAVAAQVGTTVEAHIDPMTGAPMPALAHADAMLADENEALPETGIGFATAAISGAVTGAIAAGDARGAATGAAVTVGLWSGFTAMTGWRDLGPRTRLLLSAGALLGVGSAAGLYFTRRR